MGRILTEKDVEPAVRGGAVYATSGGGWVDHGRKLGHAAVNAGAPELVSVDELNEDDWVATAAAIGAPASTTPWEMRPVDYHKAVQLLQEALGERVAALMVGQNGKSSTLNAWFPSALMGCKVLDAVGDMRAHPTGDMGAIGMAGRPDQTIQTAVGGNRELNRYIELVARGATGRASPILRTASDMSGGFIACPTAQKQEAGDAQALQETRDRTFNLKHRVNPSWFDTDQCIRRRIVAGTAS